MTDNEDKNKGIGLKLPKFSEMFKKKESNNEEKKENEEESIEIDFGSITSFVKKYQKPIIYLMLLLLIIGGVYSRTRNIPNLEGKYLVSPDDPYIFLRYSQTIADHGSLPQNDTLRYYPDGVDPTTENNFMSYLAAFTLNMATKFNPNITMFDVAAYLTPALFAIALVAFFFLSKELFTDEKIALVSTGLLAFSPAILLRTVSGFLEKEPLFLPLFFLSMLFFIKAYKTKDKKMYLFAGIAGLCTGLASFTSGLFVFILVYLSFFLIAEVILQKFNKNKLMIYLIWFGLTLIITSLTTTKYGGFLGIYTNLQFQLVIVALVLGIISVLFKILPRLERIQKKFSIIPEGIFYALIALIIILIGSLILFGLNGVSDKVGGLVEKVFTPFGTDRMTTSVSENQPPAFYGGGSSWWSTFGVYFSVGNQTFVIGAIFLMFFVGAIVLFNEEFKKFKYGKYLIGVFAVFSLALIFENFSANQNNNWINILFSQQWFFISLFGASFLVFLLLEHKSKEHIEQINSINLLVIVWYLVSIVATNGAVRLFFVMATPATLLAAYFVKWAGETIPRYTKDSFTKYLPYLLAIAIIIPMFFAVSQSVASMQPGLNIWYDSMDWIKNNTEENAVFTHWWDYGYLVQTMANRATIGDPGNFHPERNYDIGGHVFNALNNSEILDFGEKYDIVDKDTYLLIPSEDVLKFVQISRLGSLSPGAEGRETFFTVYGFQNQNESVVPNNLNMHKEFPLVIIFAPLTGQSPVMENFRIGNTVYDGMETYVINYLQPASENETGPVLVQIFNVRTQKMEILPVTCVCENKICEELNVTGVPVCALKVNGGFVNIPIKSKDILFTQLYLLDRDIPEFEKVYDNGFGWDINTARGAGPLIRIYKYNWTAIKDNEGW